MMTVQERKTYSIREMGKMFGVPSSTMRYYEDLGLLPGVERDEKGQRIYTDEHVGRMYAIACFKRTGLPMAKIHDFFEYDKDLPNNIDAVIEMMKEHERNIMEQMEKMHQDLLHIQQKVRFYGGIKEALETDSPWPKFEDFE